MLRKTFVLVITAFMLVTASAAIAQTGNPGNGNPGNGNPGNGNPGNGNPGNGNPGNGNGGGPGGGNSCNNPGNNPNCQYPAQSSIVVRDANGNIVDGSRGLRVGDLMNIVSDGWFPNSLVRFDFLSDPIHLGDVAADSTGTVRASFRVPQVEPGMHTLRLTGIGADGRPRIVEYPILVIADAQVLGQTLDNSGSTGSGGGGRPFNGPSVFGKTGLDRVADIAGIGLALLAVGLVLTLAMRRSRGAGSPLPPRA